MVCELDYSQDFFSQVSIDVEGGGGLRFELYPMLQLNVFLLMGPAEISRSSTSSPLSNMGTH